MHRPYNTNWLYNNANPCKLVPADQTRSTWTHLLAHAPAPMDLTIRATHRMTMPMNITAPQTRETSKCEVRLSETRGRVKRREVRQQWPWWQGPAHMHTWPCADTSSAKPPHVRINSRMHAVMKAHISYFIKRKKKQKETKKYLSRGDGTHDDAYMCRHQLY